MVFGQEERGKPLPINILVKQSEGLRNYEDAANIENTRKSPSVISRYNGKAKTPTGMTRHYNPVALQTQLTSNHNSPKGSLNNLSPMALIKSVRDGTSRQSNQKPTKSMTPIERMMCQTQMSRRVSRSKRNSESRTAKVASLMGKAGR